MRKTNFKKFLDSFDGRGVISKPKNGEIVLLRVIEIDGGAPIEHQLKAKYVQYKDGYWAFVRENNSIIIDQYLVDDAPDTKYRILFIPLNLVIDDGKTDISDIE